MTKIIMTRAWNFKLKASLQLTSLTTFYCCIITTIPIHPHLTSADMSSGLYPSCGSTRNWWQGAIIDNSWTQALDASKGYKVILSAQSKREKLPSNRESSYQFGSQPVVPSPTTTKQDRQLNSKYKIRLQKPHNKTSFVAQSTIIHSPNIWHFAQSQLTKLPNSQSHIWATYNKTTKTSRKRRKISVTQQTH